MKSSEITRKLTPVELAIKEHIARGIPFSECMFRPGSEAFTEFYTRVREMRESLNLDWQDQELLDTDIGECIMIEGERVPLDVPIAEEVELDEISKDTKQSYLDKASKDHYDMFTGRKPGTKDKLDKRRASIQKVSKDLTGKKKFSDYDPKTKQYTDEATVDVGDIEKRKMISKKDKEKLLKVRAMLDKEKKVDEAEYQGKEVKLNSPKRGGPKKYYVYVKNPKTGRVKKISWGDTTGLKTKSGNRDAVRSFVARHKCKQKNDKMKAGYWACRTPRYKALGVKGGQWW